MKFCNMAVVVPVDQLTGSKAALSAQGNHIGSEVKETITNKMIFNVLTPNGFKALT